MGFPHPLALLSLDGHPQQVNRKFSEQFNFKNLNQAVLYSLATEPDGTWKPARLLFGDSANTETRVNAIPVGDRVLLIVEEPESKELLAELERLRARIGDLEHIAATDHLTGAWNRAHLDRIVDMEVARSIEGKQPLSLILIDIDHFKGINDKFGHAIGDLVLKELVNLVRNRVRTSDMLFRWGGEEFVLLTPSAGHRHAQKIAESLRQIIANHDFQPVGTVTASIGVAEHSGNENASDWFRRVDKALYEAKQTGRNRVVAWEYGNSDTWANESGNSALHLVWQEAYECGDPTIDSEHQKIFQIANKLIDATLKKQSNPTQLRVVLGELLDHIKQHFSDEEKVLEEVHYPYLEGHRLIHAGLVRRSLQMKEKLETGHVDTGAIVQFLARDVVARHMMIVDRAFFPFFSMRINNSTHTG